MNNEADELLREVLRFTSGDYEYDFTTIPDPDKRDRAQREAWFIIQTRIEDYLETVRLRKGHD
jgi:hypothetical protein